MTSFPALRAFAAWSLLAVALVGWMSRSASAALDADEDGMPDVWALVHGLAPLELAPDSDGDGQSNAQEAIAGTNPLAADSVIRISSLNLTGAGVELSFPALAGKRYAIERGPTPGGPVWDTFAIRVPAEDGPATEIVPLPEPPGPIEFYRVTASDTDTDNDGVTDFGDIAGYTKRTGLVVHIRDHIKQDKAGAKYEYEQHPDPFKGRALAPHEVQHRQFS